MSPKSRLVDLLGKERAAGTIGSSREIIRDGRNEVPRPGNEYMMYILKTGDWRVGGWETTNICLRLPASAASDSPDKICHGSGIAVMPLLPSPRVRR
jgi:hypothetical protein